MCMCVFYEQLKAVKIFLLCERNRRNPNRNVASVKIIRSLENNIEVFK